MKVMCITNYKIAFIIITIILAKRIVLKNHLE